MLTKEGEEMAAWQAKKASFKATMPVPQKLSIQQQTMTPKIWTTNGCKIQGIAWMGGIDRIHHVKHLEKRRQEALLSKWKQKSEENKKRVDQPIFEMETTAFFGEAGPSGMDENITIEDLEDD